LRLAVHLAGGSRPACGWRRPPAGAAQELGKEVHVLTDQGAACAKRNRFALTLCGAALFRRGKFACELWRSSSAPNAGASKCLAPLVERRTPARVADNLVRRKVPMPLKSLSDLSLDTPKRAPRRQRGCR
jgi:hypothetical protein